MTTRPNRYAQAYQNFRKNTENHTLTVIKEDGLYRHLRFGGPGTRAWSADIITWPGYLATVGDIADGYTFTRLNDMLSFFRRPAHLRDYYEDGAPSIDFRYWAEKLAGGRSFDVREYAHQEFLDYVKDTVEENDEIGLEVEAELQAEINGLRSTGVMEESASAQVDSLEIDLVFVREQRQEIITSSQQDVDKNAADAHEWFHHGGRSKYFSDTWEHDFSDYNIHFLFACYIIDAAISAYDELAGGSNSDQEGA